MNTLIKVKVKEGGYVKVEVEIQGALFGRKQNAGGRRVISELVSDYSKSRSTAKIKYLLRIIGLLLNEGL